MSRSGYVDDMEDQWAFIMYRGRVTSAIRGKRGQQLLRDALAALDEMSEKRLIADELVREGTGDVCLLGAVGRKRGVADIDRIDPEAHNALADRFNVAACLIKEIEYVNDEDGYRRDETPEKRFERVRKWLVENIKA